MNWCTPPSSVRSSNLEVTSIGKFCFNDPVWEHMKIYLTYFQYKIPTRGWKALVYEIINFIFMVTYRKCIIIQYEHNLNQSLLRNMYFNLFFYPWISFICEYIGSMITKLLINMKRVTFGWVLKRIFWIVGFSGTCIQ